MFHVRFTDGHESDVFVDELADEEADRDETVEPEALPCPNCGEPLARVGNVGVYCHECDYREML